MGKLRALADKLFTPTEIVRFNAHCKRLQDKYLTLDTYKLNRPKWMNVRYFSDSECDCDREYSIRIQNTNDLLMNTCSTTTTQRLLQ